jgi:DNA-binding response OmpR family regulator
MSWLLTSGNNPKILLVDDEADILNVFRKGLEIHGFQVDAFSESDRAIDEFKPYYYDSIILDVRMPKLNGFDRARLIWKKDETARICFLTAFEIYEDEAKKVFKDLKTHCFVKKPITPKTLVEHIEKHLLNA